MGVRARTSKSRKPCSREGVPRRPRDHRPSRRRAARRPRPDLRRPQGLPNAGDDPPTATTEPRSLSHNRRWQHLLPRRAQSSVAGHARIASAKPCGPKCRRRLPKEALLRLGIVQNLKRVSSTLSRTHLTNGDPELPRRAASRTGRGARRPFPGAFGTLQETQQGPGLGEPGRNHNGAPAIRPRAGRPLPAGASGSRQRWPNTRPGSPAPRSPNFSWTHLNQAYPHARAGTCCQKLRRPRCACRGWYSRCR
jgi:hypothetical protein